MQKSIVQYEFFLVYWIPRIHDLLVNNSYNMFNCYMLKICKQTILIYA